MISDEYTKEQIEELVKCSKDPAYFISNYCYVNRPSTGKTLFKLHDHQIKVIRDFQNNRFNLWPASRQEGKTSLLAAYAYWFANFHAEQIVLCTSVGNRGVDQFVHILRFMYENTPDFLKCGTDYCNKQGIQLDNNSRIMVQRISPCAGIGLNVSLFLSDELAYAKLEDQEEMWCSLVPIFMYSGRCIVASTPNLSDTGDFFAKLCDDTVKGKTNFNLIRTSINEIPGRDQAWQEKMKAMLGEERFKTEYLAEFKQTVEEPEVEEVEVKYVS